ncbi:hypothetical protein [Streptomyces sp. PA5.6]|uniref:hypothetical protein n=1 Tax=Streptomyces sp. PA5.6 TaxID=3035651 RepID=UPI003904D1D7
MKFISNAAAAVTLLTLVFAAPAAAAEWTMNSAAQEARDTGKVLMACQAVTERKIDGVWISLGAGCTEPYWSGDPTVALFEEQSGRDVALCSGQQIEHEGMWWHANCRQVD